VVVVERFRKTEVPPGLSFFHNSSTTFSGFDTLLHYGLRTLVFFFHNNKKVVA